MSFHLLFLYFIMIYSAGLSALLILTYISVKLKEKWILSYTFFYFAFTIKVILGALNLYVSLNILNKAIFDGILYADIYVTLILSFSITAMTNVFFRFPFSKTVNIVSYSAALALAILYITGITGKTIGFAYILLAYTCIYALIAGILSYHKMEKIYRKMAFNLLIGLGIFIPLIFIPIFLENCAPDLQTSVPIQLITFPLYYAYHGIFFSVFLIHYYKMSAKVQPKEDILQKSDFYRKYSLTGREIEVLEMILSGESNKAIGEKLFISVPTVKKHIHNIFQKTGIGTRFQLISMMKRINDR